MSRKCSSKNSARENGMNVHSIFCFFIKAISAEKGLVKVQVKENKGRQ